MRIKFDYKKVTSEISWIIHNTKHFVPGIVLIMALGALSSLSGVALAIASKNTVDNAVDGNLRMAALNAAFFAGTIIIMQVSNVWFSLLSIRISESMSNSIRQGLYEGLTATEWVSLSAHHSGDLLNPVDQ